MTAGQLNISQETQEDRLSLGHLLMLYQELVAYSLVQDNERAEINAYTSHLLISTSLVVVSEKCAQQALL